tara:strand:+ start:780 stop:1322 length:543 start_codon:yes stop_codon:yes gene_type:complete
MIWILLAAACSDGKDTAQEAPECARSCLDSPYHRCGAYIAQDESLSCSALKLGVAMDDWTAYSLTVDGSPIESVRLDGKLIADCEGSALLQVWSVDEDLEGCGMVESVPQTCAAVAGGLPWDADVTGWSVEAIGGSKGDVLLSGAYTTQNRLYAACPKGVEMVRVVGVLPDLNDIGADLW